MAEEKQTCPRCGEKVGTYVPRMGDGSQVVMRVHNVSVGVRCLGSRRPSVETQ